MLVSMLLLNLRGNKTVYDSAVINTIWFDFDHNKDVINV